VFSRRALVVSGTDLAAGTEDVAAAAQEIAAAAEELNASTEEIAASATRLAEASVKLTGEIGKFQLDGKPSDRPTVTPGSGSPPQRDRQATSR